MTFWAAAAIASDVDGDGVDDLLDFCNNTPQDIAVDVDGRPIGDIDLDCDTDNDDYILFQAGFTGPLTEEPVVSEDVEIVHVGNAGAAGSDYYNFGYVPYVFDIGMYEVTAKQYTKFLNAVAAEDRYELYSRLMWTSFYGCKIQRNGFSGSYRYNVADDWADRPVNYVSWADAARFANWMHNGQGSGDTETGSYEVLGAMDAESLAALPRSSGATWVIPTRDEWHKAAYHYANGYLSSHYWAYPCQSDQQPQNALVDPDPGNTATYRTRKGTMTGVWPYYRTKVGAHENSSSPYGTFDQGGNVWEWTETPTQIDIERDYRAMRGGSLFHSASYMWHKILHTLDPTIQQHTIGFRLAKLSG